MIFSGLIFSQYSEAGVQHSSNSSAYPLAAAFGIGLLFTVFITGLLAILLRRKSHKSVTVIAPRPLRRRAVIAAPQHRPHKHPHHCRRGHR